VHVVVYYGMQNNMEGRKEGVVMGACELYFLLPKHWRAFAPASARHNVRNVVPTRHNLWMNEKRKQKFTAALPIHLQLPRSRNNQLNLNWINIFYAQRLSLV